MTTEKSDKKDQRATDRLFIPGGVIVLRKKNRLGLLEKSSTPIELTNFTKSGIAFKSDNSFQIGEAIYLDIIIPGEKSLRLVSEIRWIDESNSTVGAQFKAFGEGRNYNPLNALEKLRLLQRKYG
jgi:hypothetical protein